MQTTLLGTVERQTPKAQRCRNEPVSVLVICPEWNFGQATIVLAPLSLTFPSWPAGKRWREKKPPKAALVF
jgi:hypothetical protein